MKHATLQDMQNLLNELVDLLGIKVQENARPQYNMGLFKLTVFMQREFPAITIESVLLAYNLGIKGVLPDGKGGILEMFAELNPRAFGKVMTGYKLLLQEEAEAIRIAKEREAKAQDRLPENAAVPSPEVQEKNSRFLFGCAYTAIAAGKTYHDLGNALYDWLYRTGRIPFSQERKDEMLAQAKIMVERDHRVKGHAGNGPENRKARSIAEIMEKNLPIGEDEAKGVWQQIYSRAKQIAFETLIKELIEMEVTPEEFFTN